MGDAAALPDHDRGRAPPASPAQGLRGHPGRIALKPDGWLDLFSRAGAGVRDAVLPLIGTERGRSGHGRGAGGDTTLELDRVAEAVVFTHLAEAAAQGERFSVLSEEAGHRPFGADYPLVLVDPVDGSLNAEHGIPLAGLMLAVLDGPNVEDTFVGFVLNLNTGERWTSVRKQGAQRNGAPLQVLHSSAPRLALLGLESTPRALTVARPLVERASKIRILGSMALSIALTAAGGFDAFCAPIPVRMFDTAASLLILAEAGGVATDISGEPVAGLRCSLDTRSSLLCAPTAELHAVALDALRAG